MNRFTLFFTFLSLYTLWLLLQTEGEIRYGLVWIFLNFLLFSVAYARNSTDLILAKSRHGKVNYLFLVLNAPWLLFTWVVFQIQMLLSRENRVDQIEGSSIFVASRPLRGFDFSSYDLVVDLTAEFLKDRVEDKKYLCFPNLDGMPLSSTYDDVEVFKNRRVLVHCANGHGRSALFVASLLLDMREVESFDEGLKRVEKSRPLALPNRGQMRKYRRRVK